MKELENYDQLSTQDRWKTLSSVANMYYIMELNQKQIAERLYTSRSKISRMLTEAKELGIVRISISEPWERNQEHENNIRNIFHFKNIRVIKQRLSDAEGGKQLIYKAAAYYIDSLIRENMVVGISWGDTLGNVVKELADNSINNIPITVVPITGAARISSPKTDGLELSRKLAAAYCGTYRYIYAPLFVKTREIKASMLQDHNVKSTLKLAQSSDIILTSVGALDPKSWENFLGADSLEILVQNDAVGHIGGYFYDIEGHLLNHLISEEMIGIDFAGLSEKQKTICIALGENKAIPVIGALNGGFINMLIIDEKCADSIINFMRGRRT
jgi:DNA-binding transcriptional regulator LsrR (DeoR family)